MRNAAVQRASSMIPIDAMQQPSEPHVSHAEIQDGQRCALLTTKSRNTWTRATVFSSSG